MKSRLPVNAEAVQAACEIDDTPQFTQCTLMVSGVAPTITEDNDGPVREVFSKYGRLIQLHVVEGHSGIGDGKPPHQQCKTGETDTKCFNRL